MCDHSDEITDSSSALEWDKRIEKIWGHLSFSTLMVAFPLIVRILGECSTIRSLPVLFFFFFFSGDSCAHYFHSLTQNQSTVAQQAEMTVTECSLTSWV